MLSVDEPLDLKLPSGRAEAPLRLGKRSCSSSICAPLGATRPRLIYTTFPSPPSSPDSQSPSLERPGSCFTPPAMDLSLSPASRHAPSSLSLSPSPSSPSPSPSSPSSPPESSHGGSSPQPHLYSREVAHHHHGGGMEGEASPQRYPFFLPLASPPRAYAFPSPVFLGSGRDTQAPPSPSPSPHGRLACRWIKCHLLFDSLQELVDHINDFHVKPEKDSGYCCQWEGCARNGRGFNARYKMLIHIRTHTNEKPHHCPTCNKSFSRLENLKIHTRSHTGEKPYICPYEGCSKRYSNSSDRFKHTRTHYVDKPYYCKMAGCLKRYTDPSSLRKHIKAHGHFVAAEPAAAAAAAATARLGPGLGVVPGSLGPLHAPGDLPPVPAAHILLPGGAAAAAAAAAALLSASLPLSAFCHARALGHHAAPLFSAGVAGGGGGGAVGPLGLADSPLFHLGLSSMLGLGAVGRRGRPNAAPEEEEEEDEEEEEEQAAAAALNLTAVRRRDPLSWVVVPPRALLLKPAVVS